MREEMIGPELSREELLEEVESLRRRADAAEETLAAISRGEVDALVVSHPSGERVFTLQNADHPYRVFVEEMNEGAVTVAQDGTVLFCNKRFTEMVGFPQAWICGRNLSEFFREKDSCLLGSSLEPCLQEGVKVEVTLNAAGGKACPAILSAHCIQLDGLSARACIITDISDKQEQLDESEERFRTALENIPAFFKMYDAGRRIMFVNSAWLCMTGKRLEEVVGAREEDLIPFDPRDEYMSTLAKTFDTAAAQSCECDYRVDGRQCHLLVECVPVMDREGRLRNVLAIGYDIGGFKRQESDLKREKLIFEKLVMKRTDELIRAQLELEKKERLADIGQLASTVAHELRNPLAAINMAGVNIGKKSKDLDLGAHLLTIRKKVAESDQIINNLLFYSRLKAPHLEPMDIVEAVMESVSAVKSRCEGRAVSFSVETEGARGKVLYADYLQIKEVLANLLNNAVDAIPMAVKGAVTVSVGADEKSVTFVIRDTGIGMSPEVAARAPDPFFTTKSKGTGLGLSVCRQIVLLHKGTMSIESAEGMGTVVTVTLPLKTSKR